MGLLHLEAIVVQKYPYQSFTYFQDIREELISYKLYPISIYKTVV